MNVCGIIAEYDPFHTGHAYQIAALRRTLGADCAVVCAMSGNWTQRGMPALAEKHLRARLALLGGADLVLELPLPWAISSAERFAQGGVAVLDSLGIVTHLCFGSECGDLAPLRQTAEVLDTEAYRTGLREGLDQGLSFPAARQRAAEGPAGPAARCLARPNDTLGVEYLRALARRGSPIVPLAVPRRGAGHGEQGRDGFASASFLRRLLRAGDWAQAGPYLLPGAQALLSAAPLSDPALAERAVLYRLRQMTAQDLAALPDCGEGLSERLYRAVRQAGSVAQVLAAAKTKRYPLSRLRRIVLWAFLGLTAADCPRQPSCLRVLGMNGTGRALLRQAARRARLPLLTKPAHAQRLSGAVLRQLELDARAADRYGLCFAQIPPCGAEWRLPPVVLP